MMILQKLKYLFCNHRYNKKKVERRFIYHGSDFSMHTDYQIYECTHCFRRIELEIESND